MRLRLLVPLLLLIASGCAGRQIAAGSGAVPSADQTLVRYNVSGSGSPLLFIHCWACDATYWDSQVARLSRDHLVVTVDLAGHGASGHQRRAWTVEAFAEDVRAVTEALDLRDVVLVGSSMGGSVALEAAALMPDRVAGVVAVDAFHDFAEPSAAEVEAFMAPLRSDFRTGTETFIRSFLFSPDADPALVDRVARDMAAAPPESSLLAMEALFSYGPEAVRAARQRAPVPVALINGSIIPTDRAAVQEHLGAPHVVVLEGLGHFPMLEDPDRFNTALQAAIRELRRSP